MVPRLLRVTAWALMSAAFTACGGDLLDPGGPGPGVGSKVQGVTNGTPENSSNSGFPEVVHVALGGGCSGTLIDPHWVLTARHCLRDCTGSNQGCNAGYRVPSVDGPTPGRVSIGPGGPLGFSRHIDVDHVLMPQQTGSSGFYYDVALIHLTEPYWGPMISLDDDDDQLTEHNVARHAGDPVTIVGYSNNNGTDDGTKRHASVSVTGRDMANDGRSIVLAGTPGANCHMGVKGDSGGPALRIDPWGGRRVVGVASSLGKDHNCESYYTYIPNAFVRDVLRRQPLDNFDDTCADADALAPSGRLRASINHVGDWDVFAIDLEHPSHVVAQSLGVGSPQTDTFAELRNASCAVIASSDDHGTGLNFRLDRHLAAGKYYLAVRHYGETRYGTGAYDLDVQISPDADDHGNRHADATVTELDSYTSKVISGAFEYGGDVDVFRVDVRLGGQLEVSTSGTGATVGELRTNTATLLARNAGSGPYGNFRITQAVSPGSYYVWVRPGSSDQRGSYSLTLRLSNSDDHGNDCATATMARRYQRITSSFETAGDRDVFRLDLQSTRWIRVTSATSVDTVARLLDSGCNQIAVNDDGGENRNFYLSRELSAGTYFVEVRPYYSTTTGTYDVLFDPIF